MRPSLDIPTTGLDHDHNAIELSIDYMKRRGVYLHIQPVEIYPGGRSMILMGLDGSFYHTLEPAARLNRKRLAALRAQLEAVDREKIAEWFKAGDQGSIIAEVSRALTLKEAA